MKAISGQAPFGYFLVNATNESPASFVPFDLFALILCAYSASAKVRASKLRCRGERPQLDNNSVQRTAERAEQLYSARADIQNVRTSVELLQGALNEAGGYEIAWRLGRAFFFLGQEGPEADAMRKFHRQGVDASKRAARAGPERVEGHFWLGVNLALLARVEHPLKAIAHALRAKRALKRAAMIDPFYHAGGPLRALARLQHKLPYWLGGGPARALIGYERAIGVAANNTVTRVYFAELLFEIGDADRACAELEAVLNAPSDPAWAFEIERDRLISKEMIKKAGR